jgi:metal-responsive CopG/Arc/MetJ family transcriptional regulator
VESGLKTVQMTVDEELLERVDKAVAELGTSRSAFAREALDAALARLEERRREEQHRQGYLRHPVRPDEVADWESEQAWGD